MTKSMKFSAKFGKFMFYFANIIIGIIFVSPLIDDLRITQTGSKDLFKYVFTDNLPAGTGFSGQLR